jgi:protein-S-isoprenylcysteine O-methyltransferase Ste14
MHRVATLGYGIACYVFFFATFLALVYEERDLLRFLGDDYRRWREQTPMFLPKLGGVPPTPVPAPVPRPRSAG